MTTITRRADRRLDLVRAARRRLAHHESGELAVILHDIAPATYLRCALIRDWLADLGVRRATLIGSLDDAPPALEGWLVERMAAGDELLGAAPSDPQPPRGALRVDIHPQDFDDTEHVLTLERLLRRRSAVTLSELYGPVQPSR